MNVRQLKDSLSIMMDESLVTNTINKLAHWINKLNESDYSTDKENDLKALNLLEKVKLIELKEEDGKTTATLTESGKELYNDFFNLGYFGYESPLEKLRQLED
ncbi:MAG: hypothetical protein ABIJ92_05175 [Candidatus Aenigmatarchaeota archaeon]